MGRCSPCREKCSIRRENCTFRFRHTALLKSSPRYSVAATWYMWGYVRAVEQVQESYGGAWKRAQRHVLGYSSSSGAPYFVLRLIIFSTVHCFMMIFSSNLPSSITRLSTQICRRTFDPMQISTNPLKFLSVKFYRRVPSIRPKFLFWVTCRETSNWCEAEGSSSSLLSIRLSSPP